MEYHSKTEADAGILEGGVKPSLPWRNFTASTLTPLALVTMENEPGSITARFEHGYNPRKTKAR